MMPGKNQVTALFVLNGLKRIGLLWLLLLIFTPTTFAQEPITIKVLIPAFDTDEWAILAKQFAAKNPGLRLKPVQGPMATNLVEDLYTSSFLLGDSPYDLVYMDIVWVPKFAAAGWLMDLSEKLPPQEQKAFLSGDLDGGRYKGKLYRVPFRSDAGLLYYRTDLLKQAGLKPPETFMEMVQISQTLQKQGRVKWGYLWQGKQYEGLAAMFTEILEGYGGFWIDPKTNQVGLDHPEAIEAVTFLQNTIKQKISPPGVTTYQEEESRRLFQSGDAVFLRNWPYVWAEANKPDVPVRGKIGLKPMVHAVGQKSGACQGGLGIGISATTRHPQEAWRAVQFLTSVESQRQYVLHTGVIPSRRALFTDPQLVKKYPHFPSLLAVVDRAVLRPPIPQYAQASDILQRYLSAAITNQVSPKAAMEQATRETRSLLGNQSK
ncbi:MAG: ABC transporter substrate-binding protein [Gloeobacterales cyanobacterium]